jgi:hypothetical protein
MGTVCRRPYKPAKREQEAEKSCQKIPGLITTLNLISAAGNDSR